MTRQTHSEPATVHVVGAGLAGLSAAVRLVQAGHRVRLYEATDQAGGRCRTFHDARLDRDIDNGNHLVLSGNRSALAYLKAIGAEDRVTIGAAAFPFVDLASGERWAVRLADGVVQWKLLAAGFGGGGGIPGVRAREWGSSLRLMLAGQGATVADVTGEQGRLFERFWEPMALGVLNTTPERGSAALLRRVFAETFARGGRHCRVVSAPEGWGHALVEPAVAHLRDAGCPIRYGRTLRAVRCDGEGRVVALDFDGDSVELGEGDGVVLALPRARVARLLPEVSMPDGDATIVNAHFRLREPPGDAPPLLGLVNARAQWIFVRDDVASVTISAADALGLDRTTPDELLPLLWDEVRRALDLPADAEPVAGRLVRERRATFDQSPESVARRPAAKTAMPNLVLAGDWTDTGLPATIEGAIRSGETAARALALAVHHLATVEKPQAVPA